MLVGVSVMCSIRNYDWIERDLFST